MLGSRGKKVASVILVYVALNIGGCAGKNADQTEEFRYLVGSNGTIFHLRKGEIIKEVMRMLEEKGIYYDDQTLINNNCGADNEIKSASNIVVWNGKSTTLPFDINEPNICSHIRITILKFDESDGLCDVEIRAYPGCIE